MIKNFAIFKVADHDGDEKKPTHSISMKVGEEYVYAGKCWTKNGTKGKYLSCSLDKDYHDKAGWSITKDPKEEQPPLIDPITGQEIVDMF